MDRGGGLGVAAILHPLNLAIRLLRRFHIDAELRQRRCGEQGDQTSQHLDQSLHIHSMPETSSGDNAANR